MSGDFTLRLSRNNVDAYLSLWLAGFDDAFVTIQSRSEIVPTDGGGGISDFNQITSKRDAAICKSDRITCRIFIRHTRSAFLHRVKTGADVAVLRIIRKNKIMETNQPEKGGQKGGLKSNLHN